MLGIDFSFSRIERDDFRRFYDAGYRVAIQDLWTGGYLNNQGLKNVAALNLADAQAEGFIIAGYSNASPWYSTEVSLKETIANAGAMWDNLDVVAVDVEIAALPTERIWHLAQALEAAGKRVCIYTGWWYYNGEGRPDWSDLYRYPQWLADYATPPGTLLQPIPGLGPVVGHQHAGSVDPFGVGIAVDLNELDANWWEGDMSAITVSVTIPAGETVGVAEIIPVSGEFYFATVQNLEIGPFVPKVGVTGPPLRRVIVEIPEAHSTELVYQVAILQV